MTEFQRFTSRSSYKMSESIIFSCILILFFSLNDVSSDQGRPPMVSPDHYNNAQNPNFQHPPPVGMPSGQVQGFGEPQKPVQYGQGYQQAPHNQHGAGHEQKILHATDMQHEKEHIAEHMDVPIDTSKMSEQELQFHYFKMHDNDNNNKLDGTELIKSLIHWHESGHDTPQAQHAQQQPSPKLFTDDELIKLIDPILQMDDTNLDGYIDYPEFIRAQQKNAAPH